MSSRYLGLTTLLLLLVAHFDTVSAFPKIAFKHKVKVKRASTAQTCLQNNNVNNTDTTTAKPEEPTVVIPTTWDQSHYSFCPPTASSEAAKDRGTAICASTLITTPLIYEKYQRSSTTWRPNQYPHLTQRSGAWEWVPADWWTAGFYPGTLYLLNERKNKCSNSNVDWLTLGRKWSEGLIPLLNGNTVGHDTGFLSFPFVDELKINPANTTARNAVQGFARLLADRYSPTVGCTRSWDWNAPDFPVIIDNMMNLEILYQAAELGSPADWRDIARRHADTTITHHLREDASTWHVIVYNSNHGGVNSKRTSQGYADWSTWSRGQGWGISGYATMYDLTNDARYLTTARRMAQLWLNRLDTSPATRYAIPPWDFDAPVPGGGGVVSADTSAAALAATGFLQLSRAEQRNGNSTGAAFWSGRAVKLLSDTAEHYFAREASWDALLKNGTSNLPNGVQDNGIVYGDYYFVKAGNMMIDMGLISC